MSTIRACGSNPPFLPSAYLRVSGLTAPCQHFSFDFEAFLAVLVDGKPRPALAVFGIDVFVPEIQRLQNVAVGIDNVIGTGHRHFLRMQLPSAAW